MSTVQHSNDRNCLLLTVSSLPMVHTSTTYKAPIQDPLVIELAHGLHSLGTHILGYHSPEIQRRCPTQHDHVSFQLLASLDVA
ncbi:uncharacterized protein SEPMUDRAFT_149331 [Sphaerulina musiva SO2202]|uniref:Uncharacterized protein n=1 Tax=Sphaerulina musiva (strain SO2202) TaxID=692275 RepID=M3D4G2_SPHMS|nr:uncharacterized protein SEPMUDRAFT_149331 [Sphaerulina musiva SO2202]EMF12774.1 hypothetical protein SEPMUDRAFT_149331 [Sphaerulina musiva SO2202]